MRPFKCKVLLFSTMLMIASCFMQCNTANAGSFEINKSELSIPIVAIDNVALEITRFETKSHIIMSKITKAQIQEWKSKYDIVYQLESGGLTGFIFDPSCNLNVMKMVATAAQKGGTTAMTDAVMNNCWLGGDELLKTEDQYRIGINDEIADLIEMPEYQVDIKTDHAMVILPKGDPVKLRLANRGDIKYAESRNKENKPFQTAIYLLERIADDPAVIESVKKDNRMYMGLLLATNEVKDKKYVAVKKL